MMKKVFFTILFVLLIAAGAFAAKAEKTNAVELSSLRNEFSGASDIKSPAAGNEQKSENNNKTSESKLPVQAKRTFSKMFNGYCIKQAVHFTENEAEVYYISAENEKESIIVKIDDTLEISIFKLMKK